MCQDTGIPIFSLEIGRETSIDFNLKEALATAVRRATDLVPLREHAVDPITRVSSDEPLFDALYSICDGDELSVAVLVKGAGSENVSALGMLEPTQDVASFVLKTVCENGGKPCPPIIVGLGIGSTFDGSARLAKKTLFRSLDEKENAFEAQMLEQINNLGIGPMGLGGRTTALRVFVEKAACHTAMLPVAVAIQCWADRKARFFSVCPALNSHCNREHRCMTGGLFDKNAQSRGAASEAHWSDAEIVDLLQHLCFKCVFFFV